MSEPKWTPAQRAAIEDRGGALLVSATAGSGKTAVLTERAVRLITDPEHPVDADRLLIVTFTNAAAAELRARIGQALLKRSQAEPGNGALRRQRMLLQRAPICTIDAFCLDLLRKHFQALDIPPDFSPADPGSVELLRASALSETLEMPTATRISAPLPTSMARATPTVRRARRSCMSTIFCAPCPITTKSWTNFWLRGRRKMDLLPPVGMICCWPKLPAVPGQQENCSAPRWPTARATGSRSWPMPRKRKRPLPGKRQRMPCWKNIPMHRNGWTRLPPCWAGWNSWLWRGSGPRFTIC